MYFFFLDANSLSGVSQLPLPPITNKTPDDRRKAEHLQKWRSGCFSKLYIYLTIKPARLQAVLSATNSFFY